MRAVNGSDCADRGAMKQRMSAAEALGRKGKVTRHERFLADIDAGFILGDALLITIVCRLVTLWLAVVLGWAAIWALSNRWTATVVRWP
jgi:hypothetical protein